MICSLHVELYLQHDSNYINEKIIDLNELKPGFLSVSNCTYMYICIFESKVFAQMFGFDMNDIGNVWFHGK